MLKALFERCPDASGAMVSGEFDSEALQQAEREGYLIPHKPLEPSRLHALLFQWLTRQDTVGGGASTFLVWPIGMGLMGGQQDRRIGKCRAPPNWRWLPP
ncbi:hypothetical protein [Cupriavidus alkaliphilus]|uniref:hypothetical protein n=1 Tax=Cupriavidus alkaliphilus TaxID=942866 RepID=UPI001839356D|nr:hypothetical protein [Cupriavidus alkaliphilus]MBB3015808.1 hypothetical protein [Cupriavidus alkaliphilus]